MKKISCAVLVAFLNLTLWSGQVIGQPAGSMLVGTVVDPQGIPVGGVKIVAQHPSGKVVGEVITDNHRQYVMQNLPPGRYHLTLDPLNTPYKGETVLALIGNEGLTVNWAVAAQAPATAIASPGTTAGAGYPGLLPFVLFNATLIGILKGTGAMDARGDHRRVGSPNG